jgi:hypothetical protein
VSLFSFEHFWCNIIRSATNGPFPFAIKLKFGRQTKITDFDLHLVIEKEVAQFEISVDDPVAVQVLNRITNLNNITLDLQLMKPLSPSQQFVKGLTLAQLQNNVNIFSVFKEMFKSNDVGMMKRPVNFNFAHKLLLSSRFRK